MQSSDAGTFVCIVQFEGGASLRFETTLSVVDKPSGKTTQHSTAQHSLAKSVLGRTLFLSEPHHLLADVRDLSVLYIYILILDINCV